MEPSEATVHIVDDDANLLRAVSRLLRSHGYVVKTYSCPSEFLGSGVPAGPACLLLDLNMPGMTGLELQQVIADFQSRLSIVFISGQGDLPAAIRAMKAGAVDFLTKPFEGDIWSPPSTRRCAVRMPPMPRKARYKGIGSSSRPSAAENDRSVCFSPAACSINKSPPSWGPRNGPLKPSAAVSCESLAPILLQT